MIIPLLTKPENTHSSVPEHLKDPKNEPQKNEPIMGFVKVIQGLYWNNGK